MITVLLDKAEFEYDIHSLVKAFYPKEEVYVSTKDKEKKEEPVHYHMDVQFAPEEIIFSWKRVEASEDNANQTGITKCVAVDYTNRKETKNSLKRTLYRIFAIQYHGVRYVDHQHRGGLCFKFAFNHFQVFFRHIKIFHTVIDLCIA
jgi:hypothetical protein